MYHFLTPAQIVLVQANNNKNYSLQNSIELFTVVSFISAAMYVLFVIKQIVINLQHVLRFSSETYQSFLRTVKESHGWACYDKPFIKHANVTSKDHE